MNETKPAKNAAPGQASQPSPTAEKPPAEVYWMVRWTFGSPRYIPVW